MRIQKCRGTGKNRGTHALSFTANQMLIRRYTTDMAMWLVFERRYEQNGYIMVLMMVLMFRLNRNCD